MRKRARGLGRKGSQPPGPERRSDMPGVSRARTQRSTQNGRKPHGPDKGRANGGLRFLLFNSEVGLGVPGVKQRKAVRETGMDFAASKSIRISQGAPRAPPPMSIVS